MTHDWFTLLGVQLLARNKEDEVELLQESLKNSRSRLDEEILHNNIIKQKRVFMNWSDLLPRETSAVSGLYFHVCTSKNT